MSEAPIVIYAVSDATGDLAVKVAVAAVRQFTEIHPEIRRRVRVNTSKKIFEVIDEAKEEGALILYTLVSTELRQIITDASVKAHVAAVDVIGPVLDHVGRLVNESPSDRPGMQYRLSRDYFSKVDSLAFTVRHDDGLGLDDIADADIIILGVSRTSKTPLSIYLAYRGFRVANIPLVLGVSLPSELYDCDRAKMVGLALDPEILISLRTSRLRKLGRPLTEDYVKMDYINEELVHQKKVFADLGNIPVINVTNKAIEEAATDILTVLGC
jgi:[pyruvate, water dikinase]-phosphate phosphotransferase / [pyruvate, water dikinase] kinase